MKALQSTLLGAILLAGTVAAVPPEITPIPDLDMNEDTLLDVDIEVTDPDSDTFLYWTETSDVAVHVNFDEELLVVHVLPEPDWNGQATLTIGVDDLNDGGRIADIETFVITVLPVNDCPETLSAPPDVQVDEDVCWELTREALFGWIADPDLHREGDTLDVQFTGFDLGEIVETDSSWIFCPFPDTSGVATVGVVVDDGDCSASSSFGFEVLSVNDCPELATSLPTLFVVEDHAGTVTGLLARFEDAEGEALSWCGAEAPSEGWTFEYDDQADQLTLTPPPDQDTGETVSLCISDGTCEASFDLHVNVSPVNDPPRLPQFELLTMLEDEPLVRAYPIEDPDGPALELDVQSSAPQLTAGWGQDSLRLESALDWSGIAVVTVEACDGSTGLNDCTTRTIVVQVQAVNDPPVVGEIADATLAEDTVLDVPVTVVDVDSPSPVMSVVSDTSAVAAVWDDGIPGVRLTPASDWHGVATLLVVAQDGAGGVDSVDFRATVTPVNDCPTLAQAFEGSSVEEDGLFALDGVLEHFGDVDGDGLALCGWEADLPEAVLTWIPEEDRLTVEPPADWSGEIVVDFCAEDAECQAEGQWTLSVEPVNDEPVLAAIPDQAFDEDTLRTVPLSFHDIDSDSLVLTAFPDGEWLAVTWRPDSLDLLLEPLPDYHGELTVTVQVDDLFGRSVAQRQFAVSVAPVNDCPVQATAWEDGAVDEDGEFVLDGVLAAFVDVDGDSLFLAGWQFDDGSATLLWDPEADALTAVPAPDWSGTLVADLLIGDGDCLVPASWTLVVGAVNDGPVLEAIENQSFEEDAVLQLEPVFHDVDSDTLAVSVASDTDELDASWDGETGLLTLTPAPDWHGEALVTVQVDDLFGRSVTTRAFIATVTAVNDAPVAAPAGEDWLCGTVEDLDAFRERLLSGGFLLDVADADGDTLTLSWFVDGAFAESFDVATTAGDTLYAMALPALDESWLQGDIALHVELSDGFETVNGGGEDCSWELGFTSLRESGPLAFELRPAWPNPFNPSTQIAFTLPQAATARLTVHDLRGAVVAVLADGPLPAGEHRRVWQPAGQASGLYFAVLVSDGRREIQRLTLLK